jgi:hypothetical protein
MRRMTCTISLAFLLSQAAFGEAIRLAQTDSTIAGFERRIDGLQNTNNAYIRLGKSLAQRFIGFAKTGGPNGQMSKAWIKLQLDEIAQVLDETEKLAQKNSPLLDWMPPKLGKVKVKNGTFYNQGRPYYFYGYGHFDSVITDLPNFPALGVSLIQDARAGPSSMNADGTLGEGALAVVQGFDLAAQCGVRDDFLLSPHYYPAWGWVPDLPSGGIGFNFNIFHPKAKAVIEKWTAEMAERIKDKPALHSVCLANEPDYSASGRDKYTRPLFIDYLKEKHHSLDRLNALYGTAYTNFNQAVVPPCAMPAETGAQRAYYDWTCFNKKMFADWHAWLGSILKAHGVKAPTHTKICVFETMDRDKVSWGVDPELMCHATDLAGCDAYAFYAWHDGGYAYNWRGHELFYDLLHSFRGQPVFNSENHIGTDGQDNAHIPMNHTRSVLWQDGLHHQGSTTIWVWEMSTDPGLVGSIYFRPINIYGASRAMLDLNRLSAEVTAINNARPRVALFYSQPSIFWQEKYKGTLFSLYAALSFMGEPITFVSERQLAAGTAAKVDWLIVPDATHILDTTTKALAAFKKSGGKILLVGKDCLSRDEYDRPLPSVPDYPAIELGGDDRATADLLRAALHPLQTAELRESPAGPPAFGIEFRVVPMGRATLVPMNNFNNDARTVTLSKWAGRQALDLINGETVDLKAISLEPMVPRLLRISR